MDATDPSPKGHSQGRTDESALVMPDTWMRERHPRRDRPGPHTARIDGSAAGRARALVDGARAEIEELLALPGTDPELAGRGRSHLAGEADPLGAAVVALSAIAKRGLLELGGKDPFHDAWAAEHGLVFAACACAEAAEVMVDWAGIGVKQTWHGVRRRLPADSASNSLAEPKVLRHLRALLASAEEDVYEEVAEKLAGHRRTPLQKAVVSYLVPTRENWVTEVCADPPKTKYGEVYPSWMVFCALGAPDQVETFGRSLGYYDQRLNVIVTLLEGVGPAAVVPLLAEALDGGYVEADTMRSLLQILVTLPVDEAFQALLDRLDQKYVHSAAATAAKRCPARALRLLAPLAADSRTASPVVDLLTGLVLADPVLVDEMLPGFSEESRAVIGRIRAADVRIPDAAAEGLPPILAAPPWTRPRKAAKPVVITGLTPPDDRGIAWEPGERERWAVDPRKMWRYVDRLDMIELAKQFRDGRLPGHQEPTLFLKGQEELVRPLLAGWEPKVEWDVAEWLRPVAARFELDALNVVRFAVNRDPANLAEILLPFLSADVARSMADWLVRLKAAGKVARTWFRRHGRAAVPYLLPGALGKTGAERRAAEAALRFIVSEHGAEGIVEAARVHGERAAGAIEALLTADPLDVLPARMPEVGDWADPRLLPQILLRGRERALSVEATGHVLTMFALSTLDEVCGGVEIVRELADPESLAEFGWGVFQRWDGAGAPSKEGWALTQLAWTGDDETVRRLTPRIRAWPGDGGHHKAVAGLDVLAAIGSDVALMHLQAISQKAKFKGLQKRAQDKVGEVAAELELTAGQLADRLVPDFGLDADGSLRLDYGPRRFVVGFDEQLRPYVADEDGKRRKALPKPGAKDDPELAPAAYKRFSALRKDVRTVASDLLRRLETAMVTRRRWSMGEFRELLVGHPLVWHIVRRLVWLAAEDGADGTKVVFRIAEDRTFADVDDDVPTLPDSASVSVAHPLDLGESLPAWAEVFADYEILQPFPQLARAVHTLTEEERAGGRLERFEGVTVPVGTVMGLQRRGWERGTPLDAGFERWISRRITADRHVVVNLEPGIAVGVPENFPAQTLKHVWLSTTPDDFRPNDGTSLRFGGLDPAVVSEVVADLTDLTEGTETT